MADESYDDLDDQFSDWIAQAKADGQDPGSLTQMRSRLRRAIKDAKEAEDRGFKRAQAEHQAAQARVKVFTSHGIPDTPLSQRLFEGIDLTDQAAVDAHVADLKAQGFQWQPPADKPTQQLDPAQQSLDRMSEAQAGGQVTGNDEDDWARRTKAAIDCGDHVSDEDREKFWDYVSASQQALVAAQRGAGM